MQVFVPYKEPLKVAQCLDKRRLSKQIIECQQIIDAIGLVGKGWINHPVTKMYTRHLFWLIYYKKCLYSYCMGLKKDAERFNDLANAFTPSFLTEEFCCQHKRRLYTKDKEFYKCFEKYGESEENWYYIDYKIVKYINGKRIS